MSEHMLFCLGEDSRVSSGIGYQKNYMVFNTQVTEDEYKKIKGKLPEIKISHTYWIEEKDMTDKEKKDFPFYIYKQTGGYLKMISYEDAWLNWWSNASSKDKKKILDIPYFNWDIFTGITGIKQGSIKDSTDMAKEIDKLEKQIQDLRLKIK